MAAHLRKHRGPEPTRAIIESRFREEDLDAHAWSNAPGDQYGWHSHEYHKVLYCIRGSIRFHTDDGDIDLRAGDRLDVEPHTEHAATVGPQGVECMEAAR